MELGSFPTVYNGDMLPGAGDRSSLWKDYVFLMLRLHGKHTDDEPSLEFFWDLIHDQNEILFFVVFDGRIVSTAQGTLAKTFPVWRVYINNVVTHDDYEGQGYGRMVLDHLVDGARVRWGGGDDDRILRFELTNSPGKENAGFYEKLGFRARTKENDDKTVVWVKDSL